MDPLQHWASVGEKPDYAGLLTFAGVPYTQDAAHLEGVDVAIVGAPMDDLVSDRPGTRFGPRAIRAASSPSGTELESAGSADITALAADRIIREILGGIALRRRRQSSGQTNNKEER